MRCRSLLFTPANAPHRFAKAWASGADIVIIDLEDAVSPLQKNEARANLQRLRDRTTGPRLAVRINAIDTAWYRLDLEAVIAAGADMVMLPKCSGVRDLLRLDGETEAIEARSNVSSGSTQIIGLVGEDASSLDALDYKGITPRLCAIALGAEDLSADLGINPRTDDGSVTPLIAHARALVVLAARRAGVPAIDTPFPDIANPDAHEREAKAAAALGFVGKMCIHPSQIAAINGTFEPSSSAVARARRVVSAFDDVPDRGVLELDGKMVDRAHLQGALRLLERLG